MAYKIEENIGLILDVWWKVVEGHRDDKLERAVFRLENQANGQILERVDIRTIENVKSGRTHISSLISKRLRANNINSRQEWW